MKRVVTNGYTKVWISSVETTKWARNNWPGSYVRGKRIYAEFEPNGDLVDVTANGHSYEGTAAEFDALITDMVGNAHPRIERPYVDRGGHSRRKSRGRTADRTARRAGRR